MTPTLSKVIRLDSLPLNQTYYTEEGYLIDRPVLTSTGIFEYHNQDGSIRRELRLPEDVFDAESLKSYKGRPIIITHDAGLVNKDNVHDHQIGTILTDGYRSGEDVRAEIIIHDTDEMKSSGLKELSLGYNLDLEETPGEWNGQHYDAIQRNIRINHLALVREARAGEQARLNIDSRDPIKTLKGGKAMSNPKNTHRGDGVLTPEELAKAIEEYKNRRAAQLAAKDGDAKPVEAAAVVEPVAEPAKDGDEPAIAPAGEKAETIEEKVQMVKDRQDNLGEPKDKEAALGVIAQKDEDMGILYDIIDTMLAQKDFDCATTVTDGANTEPAAPAVPAVEKDGDDEDEPDDEPDVTDGTDPAVEVDPGKQAAMNADSIDAIVRERIKVGMVGRSLNMDGLEDMNIRDAKKAIITAVRPGLHLDGKSDAYINAAYDMALEDVQARNDNSVARQKQQMFNKDSKVNEPTGDNSASARARMIERQQNKKN